MNETIEKKFNEFEHFLSTIDQWDLPTFKDQFYRKVDNLSKLFEESPDREALEDRFFEICDLIDNGPLHSRARNKPLGYAGDYLIIDWIYTRKTAKSGLGKYFDQFFHTCEAAQAVRNRKKYFINKCLELSHKSPDAVNILDLGCGPCRDVLETFQASSNGKNLHFHCIDHEVEAIQYASKLLRHTEAQNNIRLEQANVLRFRSNQKYDLIWSAGLFDYLEDGMASLLLKKLWRFLKDDGQIIFGNFSPSNPTKTGMDLALHWKLIHRSAYDLIQLCRDAKLPFKEIEVESEPMGVNLFCIIKK